MQFALGRSGQVRRGAAAAGRHGATAASSWRGGHGPPRCILVSSAGPPTLPPSPLQPLHPQNHSNEDIYEKAVAILETYFDVEDGEEENLAPAVAEGGEPSGRFTRMCFTVTAEPCMC